MNGLTTATQEVGRTVRAAMKGWPETVRLVVLIIVIAAALVICVRFT